jgi:hypothetical protein
MMVKLPKDLREFIELLNSHDVRYLNVGGYAVAYHGHPRMTGDIDIFIDISDENARKLEAVTDAFGFASLGLTAPDFLEPGTIIQLGKPPNSIDLLSSLSGVTFDDVWQQRVSETVDGVRLVFIDKTSLLVNKSATGRPKDLADIDALS